MSQPPGLGQSDLDRSFAGEPPRGLADAEAVTDGPPDGARRAFGTGVALIVFALVPLGIAVRVGWQPLLDLDKSVSDALVVPGRGRDVDVLRMLTDLGLLLTRSVVILPLALWFAIVRRWQLIVFVVVAGFGISPITGALKLVFNRARPVYDGTIEVGGLSFPSGHSSGAAVLATSLVVVAWPVLSGVWRWVWVALMALVVIVVGYTRIALGAHFLSDVIAGWSVGIAWALLLAIVLQVWPGQLGALREPESPVRP